MKRIAIFLVSLILLLLLVSNSQADNSIEVVPVGNAGNAADTRYRPEGYGNVDYNYCIGKYEITNAQWREFLSAKASIDDPNELYNPAMSGTYGGIDRSGSGTQSDPYVYTTKDGDANWDNRPVNYVSFWDAARFANWLHNGQGNGDTESGAYINIGNQDTFARQSDAKWWIPSEDEWYKAAYHQNDGVTANYFDYPTATNEEPSNDLTNPDPGNNANFEQDGYAIGDPYYTTIVGEFENSPSPYGTFDQGGNLWEWNETVVSSSRGLRGGRWYVDSHYMLAMYRYYSGGGPSLEHEGFGFRVACVPEPSSLILFGLGMVSLAIIRKRQR